MLCSYPDSGSCSLGFRRLVTGGALNLAQPCFCQAIKMLNFEILPSSGHGVPPTICGFQNLSALEVVSHTLVMSQHE